MKLQGRQDSVDSVERKRLKRARRKKVRAKVRALLWRAWAQRRPISGGAVLYYTSLREQHVYSRARLGCSPVLCGVQV